MSACSPFSNVASPRSTATLLYRCGWPAAASAPPVRNQQRHQMGRRRWAIAALALAAAAAVREGMAGEPRRLQAGGSCDSYFEVTAAANAVETACCPPGSSFAMAGCQMSPEMDCTPQCSAPFLEFFHGPCLDAVRLSPQVRLSRPHS